MSSGLVHGTGVAASTIISVLDVPSTVYLRYVDLSIELQVLGFYRARREELAGGGETRGERGPIIRRRLATYARASVPYFRLRRLWRGSRASNWLPLDQGQRPGSFDWLPMSSCRFMFLLFTRPHESA